MKHILILIACAMFAVVGVRADETYRITKAEIEQPAIDGLAELKRQDALGGALGIVYDPYVSMEGGVCKVGVTFRKWKVSVPVSARIYIYPVDGGRAVKFWLTDIQAGRYGCGFVKKLALKVAKYFMAEEDGITFEEDAVTVSTALMVSALADIGETVSDRVRSVQVDHGAIDIVFTSDCP